MNYIDILKELLVKNELIEIIISGKEEKKIEYNKVSIKPFLKDEVIFFQFAYVYEKKLSMKILRLLKLLIN